MRQIVTRLDDSLAQQVKGRAALAGMSVNAYVIRLLESAVADRRAFKRDAIGAGTLARRGPSPAVPADPRMSTPAGYAAALVSAGRDDR